MKNVDTTYRLLKTLLMLPVAPGGIPTTEIKIRLEDIGYDVSIRSVQRDLAKLSEFFPITYHHHFGSSRLKYWAFTTPIFHEDFLKLLDSDVTAVDLVDQDKNLILGISIVRPKQCFGWNVHCKGVSKSFYFSQSKDIYGQFVNAIEHAKSIGLSVPGSGYADYINRYVKYYNIPKLNAIVEKFGINGP